MRRKTHRKSKSNNKTEKEIKNTPAAELIHRTEPSHSSEGLIVGPERPTIQTDKQGWAGGFLLVLRFCRAAARMMQVRE